MIGIVTPKKEGWLPGTAIKMMAIMDPRTANQLLKLKKRKKLINVGKTMQ